MSQNRSQRILECCVDSVESALAARDGGAGRLELCSALAVGGITPSPALYRQIRKAVELPVHVLIRPRPGDFLYTDHEFSVISEEIDMFSEAGADGVVIGCLSPDGSLDRERMRLLIRRAGGMHVTLHRAFDVCRDPFQTLEDAVSLGINTVLTSGCKPTCLEGLALLKALDGQAAGRITVMAGGGVDAAAVRRLLAETALTAFHMSGKKLCDSGMEYRSRDVSMGLPGLGEYDIWRTDAEAVVAVRALL